ncbi:MAG TPA: hypothetical protein VHA73_10895 [Acidimicrobiales bacterium]|jgi:hypothetical protein|nr:hypothetical protein [Acidimicrobiales bacterium]
MHADDLLLVPRPRSIELLDGGAPAGGTSSFQQDRDLEAEGYTIDAGPGGVAVRHGSRARRHAVALLEQLRAQCDGAVPCCHVVDGPAIAVRGYMLDVSRDRVPTRDTLSRLVELLALARYNHFELYVEHPFEFAGHEVVWKDASPLTGDDLEWLDHLCAEHGIDLVVNQNTFGHMGRWLAHDEYRWRAECPDGFEIVDGVAMPPSLLAPTPDNAEFALGLVRQQLAHVRSRQVNIGCDETFELGQGYSAQAVAERGKGAVYGEHLMRLAEPLIADGLHVLFWGDIAGRHPEVLAALPADSMTALVWQYEAPSDRDHAGPPASLAEIFDRLDMHLPSPAGFVEGVRPFADAGFPFWVCPGTSSWNSIVGRIDNAKANLVDAATIGVARGAGGLLVTDWGDNGHFQPPSVSFGPLVYGGALAWDPRANVDLDLATVLDRYVFADEAGVLGAALDRLGRMWAQTGQKGSNGSPLLAALCPSQVHFVSGEPDAAKVGAVADDIDELLAQLDQAAPACADGELVVQELAVAARMARHGAWRLLAKAGGPARSNAMLAADLDDLIADYEQAWLARSRPGGLADSRAHLEATRAQYDRSAPR